MIRALARAPFHRTVAHLARNGTPPQVRASQFATHAQKDNSTDLARGPGHQRRHRQRGVVPFSDNILDMDPFGIMASMMPSAMTGFGNGLSGMRQSMAMDLTESDKQFTIKVDIPGVDKEDITLEAHGDQLSISVDHSETKDTEEGEGEERAHRIERSRMAMSRSVRLPPRAKLDSVHASYTNGVLTLAVPKVADSSPDSKKIEIK